VFPGGGIEKRAAARGEGRMMRRSGIMTMVAAGVLTLAACGGGNGGSSASSGSSSSSGSAAAPAAELISWQSPLGEIVVTGQGRAVYVFDKDTDGSSTSACTGQCTSLWSAVTTTSSTPEVSGVTGDVGTAPGTGDAKQVTLDGHRLYTYSGDSAAQQVNGQGFMGIWWVVAPDGSKVTDTASASASPSGRVDQPTY
jgi:predicted lipoprotein with Yx(FWY)xxD motif